MAVHKSRRSILSLKSWLFTPGRKPTGLTARLKYMPTHSSLTSKMPLPSPTSRKLALPLCNTLSSPQKVGCHARFDYAPVTRTGIEDLHSLLESSAAPDYIILPKCDSPAFISMVRALLDQAAKETEIIALIE